MAKNSKMKVLSLFDGISCARVAMKKAGIPVTVYFASEIDKYAIEIAQKNFPDTVQIGDIKTLREKFDLNEKFAGGIGLMIGGSPCQDLSIAKNNRKGLDGERSGLFWEYVRILKEVKPKWFVLENVASMAKSQQAIITETLGVQPIMINAALVSAQNRKRLFWTNIPNISSPADRGIMLKDILLDGNTEDLKSLCITATYHKKNERDFIKKGSGQMIQVGDIGGNAQSQRVYDPKGKSTTLNAGGGGLGAKTGLYITQRPRGKNKGGDHREKSPTVTSSSFEHNNHVVQPVALRNRGQGKKPEYNGTGKANAMTTVQTDSMVEVDYILRKLHPIECERLQGVPDNYTAGVSNTQRYKALGNGFHADVIAHILSFIPKVERD